MSNKKRLQNLSSKIVLLGDAAVGKSSIVLRLTKNSFSEYGESTIGAAYVTTSIETETAVVKFELWDTAGQERYNALAPMFYRNAAAALIVYDITSRNSLDRAKRWVTEIQSQPGTIIVLIGNKVDMENLRQIPKEVAEQYAQEAGVYHFEASAKTNTNIHEIFQYVADKLALQSTGGAGAKSNKSNQQTIIVDDNSEPKKGCC
jgi:Ras-related protein Rab-5C